jgi:hypothetical protein
LYDSCPFQIEFFGKINREILSVDASGALTTALARRIRNVESNPKAKLTSKTLDEEEEEREVYMWGYYPGSDGSLKKAVGPLLVTDSLNFERVERVDAACRNVVTIVGVRDGRDVLGVYGNHVVKDVVELYSPLFIEMEPVKNLYTDAPLALADLSGLKAADVQRVLVLRGMF